MAQFKFVTKIYHPNVKTDDGARRARARSRRLTALTTGTICTDILGDGWSPQLKIHEGASPLAGCGPRRLTAPLQS